LRISTDKPDEDDYQIEKAKSLLPQGKFMDLVQGKCPEEFFTVVIRFYLCYYCREYGLIGGFGVLILYLLLLFRFVVAT
jgi:cell division protein FtsW